MKPVSFEYTAPERLDEVIAALGDDRFEARVIAGGQSLVPMMNFRLARPELLVDLRRVAGLGLTRRSATEGLTVGATVTQGRLLRELSDADDQPLLAEGLRHVGHPQTRSRGTVCGSLAHHDPTAELPALAVALDAELTVAGPDGSRTVDADEFFVSRFEVALEPGEVLISARFPPWPPTRGWGFRELARRRGDFPLAAAVAWIDRDEQTGMRVERVRLVAFGVGERGIRLEAAEQAVVGRAIDDGVCNDAAARVLEAIDPSDDVHATAAYRREATVELVRGVLADAWERSDRG